MSADPLNSARGGGVRGSRRLMALTLAVAAVVVLAAATVGSTHFSGPRWVPHLSAPGKPKVRRPPTGAPPPRREPRTSSGFPWWIVGAVVGAIVALAIVWWLWVLWSNRRSGHRREPEAPAWERDLEVASHPLTPEPDGPLLRSGIAQALAALDETREPADAIVRAWLGLQETAEQSGILRGAAETPTEFTARILSGALADDHAIRTLLRLYLRTRFGDHPVSDDDVAAVRVALHQLIASWPVSPA